MTVCYKCKVDKSETDFYPSCLRKGDYMCKLCSVERAEAWRVANPERRRIIANRYAKKWRGTLAYKLGAQRHHATLRQLVLQHYGGKCACCGFSDMNRKIHYSTRSTGFLVIDHIHGGGRQHSLELRRWGVPFYQWLKNNNFPDGFRVLCAGCNASMEPSKTKCILHEGNII